MLRYILKKAFLALLLSVAAISALAQSEKLQYSVSGKVRDAKTGTALQFVNVFMEGRHYATVTNSDGGFLIKSDIPIDTLVFSYLGYESRKLPVEASSMTVYLTPSIFSIDPAIVLSAQPRLLVQQAIKRIPDNYSNEEELLQCFYRETMQKRQRYIYVSEAVSKLFKTPYSRGIYRDAAALVKSRILISSRRKDTLSVKFLGGPTQAVDFDVVKNLRFLLNQAELGFYNMEMGVPVKIDGRLNLTVMIYPMVERPYALYFGTFYIDSETYAFSRIELSLDMSDERKATDDILLRKPAGLRFHPKELSIVINYRLDGDRWRISFFRSLLRFSCDWRKRLFYTNYISINELVVTDKYPEAVPIPRAEQFRLREALSDKAELFTDTDFWKEYNIIEPSVSLEHAVGRLMKR